MRDYNMSKISYIIPVLNGEKYISKCLDSILNEKLPEDEIIVVDNGSTDNTLKLIYQYKEVTILQYPQVTISTLRNRGAEHAKGDLLAFIDSDCILCFGWRTAVANVFMDEGVHAAGSSVVSSDNSTWVERALQSERFVTKRKMNYINSGNFIIRKSIFEDVGGFDESLITDEDYDIGARINTKGYNIYNEPNIMVIHYGNAKTLGEHFRRKFWHSTSLLLTAFKYGIDKAFIMTLLFILFHLSLIIIIPLTLFGKLKYGYFIVLILSVPIITAIYRVIVFRNYRYFLQIIILYYVFYLARSSAIVKICMNKIAKIKAGRDVFNNFI